MMRQVGIVGRVQAGEGVEEAEAVVFGLGDEAAVFHQQEDGGFAFGALF